MYGVYGVVDVSGVYICGQFIVFVCCQGQFFFFGVEGLYGEYGVEDFFLYCWVVCGYVFDQCGLEICVVWVVIEEVFVVMQLCIGVLCVFYDVQYVCCLLG